MAPICLICERTSTTPQVSTMRPPAVMWKMKISLYVTDLPVGGIPMYSPALVLPRARVADHHLVLLGDHIFDSDVKVRVGAMERCKYVLQLLGPLRLSWYGAADPADLGERARRSLVR